MQGHIDKFRETDLSLGCPAVRPRWHHQQNCDFGAWQGLYGVGGRAVKRRGQGAGCQVAGCQVPNTAPDTRDPSSEADT